MLRRWAIVLGILLGCLPSMGAGSSQVSYKLIGLKFTSWRQSYVNGINNNGQIVGTYNTAGDSWPTFLYQNGSVTNMGSLGLPEDINSNGQIVGAYGDFFDGEERPYVYSGGILKDLGMYGGAKSINSSGDIVGYSNHHAFLYSEGTTTDLGTLTGMTNSTAFCVNNKQQVVGFSYSIGNNYAMTGHAFLYTENSMTDLETLGGTSSTASSINDNGLITGWSETSGNAETHAFLSDGESMSDLGTIGGTCSRARGINAGGQIVGESTYALNSGLHAFLYRDGTMRDLNNLITPNSDWILKSAVAINDSGWIVGNGTYKGYDMAFLLTPVPEPSVLILLGIGGLALLAFMKHNRKH